MDKYYLSGKKSEEFNLWPLTVSTLQLEWTARPKCYRYADEVGRRCREPSITPPCWFSFLACPLAASGRCGQMLIEPISHYLHFFENGHPRVTAAFFDDQFRRTASGLECLHH